MTAINRAYPALHLRGVEFAGELHLDRVLHYERMSGPALAGVVRHFTHLQRLGGESFSARDEFELRIAKAVLAERKAKRKAKR